MLRAPLAAAAAPVLALALLLPAVPASAATVADGTYRGRLSDGQAFRLTVRDGRIAAYRFAVGRYRCDVVGEIGPLRVSLTGVDARISPARRGFGFTRGPRSERVRLDGRFGRDGTVRGSARVTGTIGVGDPCASPKLTFSARRAR